MSPLSSVASEAYELIQNIPVTQQKFHVAWNLLCDRYNNQRFIAAVHVKSILSLPVNNKESATNFKSINNSVSKQLECFKALDLSIPLHEVLLSQIPIEPVDEVI
jgi:hypothetical protein